MGQLPADLLMDRPGDADASRIGERLEARRDVHSVAVDAIALADDVAQMDADPELHATRLGLLRRLLLQLALHLHRAGQRRHYAGKLGQEIVADRIDHPPTVL